MWLEGISFNFLLLFIFKLFWYDPKAVCVCPTPFPWANSVVGLTIYLVKWAYEYPTMGSS